MSELSGMECQACSPTSPQASQEERARLLPQIPEWSVTSRDGEERLERVFSFPDYAQAVEFARRVSEAAEEAGHHPAILLEWGRVTVSWWTHAIGGLHVNDFIMAARTDDIHSGS